MAVQSLKGSTKFRTSERTGVLAYRVVTEPDSVGGQLKVPVIDSPAGQSVEREAIQRGPSRLIAFVDWTDDGRLL